MQHTPEPWFLGNSSPGTRIILGTGRGGERYVANVQIYQTPRMFGVQDEQEREANARRIVAAVNAVGGIPTEALEAGVVREAVAALKVAEQGLSDLLVDELPENQEISVTVMLESYVKPALAKLRGDGDA